MNARADLYQSHLDRVSRSFAFCIQQLQEPLRDWVGLSYLLCRIVDTIEDAQWPTQVSQAAAFALFDGALEQPDALVGLKNWQNEFPASIKEGELLLLADARLLLADYHALPEPIREIIGESISSMSLGMQHFCSSTPKPQGSVQLGSLQEVNQYCFFVAGIVGELLAKLIAEVDEGFIPTQENLLRAHHFGLFLQKVNLLKDQVGDEKQGRHFIPSRPLVEASSFANARHALAFILDLPSRQVEFRRFCAWSLFLGLEALAVARDSQSAGEVLKVPRAQTESLLERVEHALNDSAQLNALFSELTARLGWSVSTAPAPNAVPHAFPQWLTQIYHGPLGPGSLNDLGL